MMKVVKCSVKHCALLFPSDACRISAGQSGVVQSCGEGSELQLV